MIVSGGGNICPIEIEDVMHSNPRALGVAVLGVPDESWKESVKAAGQGIKTQPPSATAGSISMWRYFSTRLRHICVLTVRC